MNYRHIYHAGNFADCMKHALLVSLLQSFGRKPSPFMVLDTHAGIGRYDLDREEAEKTGEWHDGIGRLGEEGPSSPLAPWLALVKKAGGPRFYPGSPLLASFMLRPQDQLICCEKHPEDKRALYRLFAQTPNVSVHERDAYEALRALLPPKVARRGLILLDPPFEEPDEFTRLAQGLQTIQARFANAVVAMWYPIKHRTPVRAFHAAVVGTGQRNIIVAELLMRPPHDPDRLNGAGLLVINPPFGFAEQARAILARLQTVLGAQDYLVETLVPE
ncbi:23S rRNA (adenine(2030)-N(6))-methyltransferase RlmJ [Acetobacter sp. TBRC 12305]|uniref:Ribosomal RNA large subunit methyltransferase J n=1 Tax=Acetobacter garciniae TaxID=2817435 RepID=A0A939HLG5_9PROT|nr:23S rRNA (adenine(2030)-N(6))-methyltransferase RlmJ [Acetobacter garciniae]MBO1323804.1 23S rRNA (adenine(2030)-N(6))-methyltransferase RlmJ [Acetobacter garciniae]MBX0343493.1 23S rRNA (adenine(2030)-N(6))-methyltransferase RlmJ [Acetobacter garciniae]